MCEFRWQMIGLFDKYGYENSYNTNLLGTYFNNIR